MIRIEISIPGSSENRTLHLKAFNDIMVSGKLTVVKPYPGHVVAIEGEKVKVSCLFVDFENKTTNQNVTKVVFIKILGSFGDSRLIPDDGPQGIYTYELNMDYFNGLPRWKGTMVVNNMTSDEQGQYQCNVNNTLARYGFTISYIKRDDLPQIEYSDSTEVNFRDSLSLYCNLIRIGSKFSVKLTSIAWYKGTKKITEVKHPEEEEALKNLNLTISTPEEAGTYECLLTALLRHERIYTINGTISVKVKPVFEAKDLDDNEIIKKKGESATMHCEAKGNPIEIEWKRQLRSDNQMTTLNKTVNSTRYIISSKSAYQGFKLEIPKTDYEDRGDYYCCIKSSSNASDQCQRFTLRVKDPLGYLWPLIGIIIEAIFIIIILLVAAKLETRKDETNNSDANTELSYEITSEGSKGSIRLRNTRSTAN